MIDMSKKYRTRDGRDARIYAIDGAFGDDGDPVHGAVLETDGWHMYTWGENGIYFCDGGQESEHDLIEAKAERWYPIVRKGDEMPIVSAAGPFESERQALAYRPITEPWTTVGAWQWKDTE